MLYLLFFIVLLELLSSIKYLSVLPKLSLPHLLAFILLDVLIVFTHVCTA